MIFAGHDYIKLYEQLASADPSNRQGKRGYRDFGDVYRISDMPVHLLPCDETGALQLAIMRQPDYNARIARAAFGADWSPSDEAIPDADGSVGGNPLVIAPDMDVRRVERVCQSARQLGRPEVMVAALRGQLEAFYFPCFQNDSVVKLLSITPQVLKEAFGESLALYSMEGPSNAKAI
jgi:hypothetical protein